MQPDVETEPVATEPESVETPPVVEQAPVQQTPVDAAALTPDERAAQDAFRASHGLPPTSTMPNIGGIDLQPTGNVPLSDDVRVAAPTSDFLPPVQRVYPDAKLDGPQAVIATCLLQPEPSYADDALVQIPTGSGITVLDDVQLDEHKRAWRRVTFEGKTGWIQFINIRPA